MKSAYKYYAVLCAAFLLVGTLRADAGGQEFNKTITKEYDISANGTTYLSNKYGKVDVKTWEKNRVKITVNIIVRTGSESTAQKVFDRINIAFSNGSDYVKAVTEIEPSKGGWSWSSWMGSDKSDYSINYEVYLPATNNLEITHRYGDVYCASMKGRVKLDVKYVNFKAEGMGDNSSVLFGYGNGSIGKARNLSSDISYSKLTVEEASNLNITSKYTQVNVGKAEDLTCTSRYDTYVLGQIQDLKNTGMYDNFRVASANSIEIASKYTQVKAEKVAKTLVLDLSYGNADAKLGQGFSKVSCTGNYTNYKIGAPEGSSFVFDGSSTYAGLQYPEGMDMEYNVQKNTSQTVKGKYGKSPAAMVVVKVNYGGAKVYTY